MAFDYEELGEIRELLNDLLDHLGVDIEEEERLGQLERLYAKRTRAEAALARVANELKQLAAQ